MMFRKIFLLSILIFSFSYAVDEVDIEKRRQEQQDFDNLIRNQNFSVPKNNEDNGQKNLILNVNSIVLEGKIDKVFYDDKENKFKTFITFPQRELFFQKMN